MLRSLVAAAALLAATPALAADKLVAVGAPEAIKEFRGKPWHQALGTCAGYHLYEAQLMQTLYDEEGKNASLTRSAEFLLKSASRYAADKGVTQAQAETWAHAETQKQGKAFKEKAAAGDDISAYIATCSALTTAYKAMK